MGKNIVEKILEAHRYGGKPGQGGEAAIRMDQTLTQDATGTMACLEFEAMGFDRVKTELSVSYVDHNTIQEGFENADDHRYLETVAAKYGMKFSKPGNGICHQVHLERFGCPGKTLLGSDSHTPTGGGIGMFAVGAGGLDVAVAMGGGPFYIPWPRVYRIELNGRLRPWVSAKDVILKVIEMLSTNGNVGVVLEYGGEGVGTLSVPERATIANMGAETGVTTSVFPSDELTKEFLDAQGRGACFAPLAADRDARYERTIVLELSALEPLIACPHSPGNIKKVREIAGQPVDQVLIGSCTNASFRDISTVAAVLKGKKIAPNVSFGVAAGSRQVLEMASRSGAVADIIAAGARILEPACGFCIGNSLAPRSKAVSVRTSNRNFEGRSGTPDAGVFLASPETALACALTGRITDPVDYFAREQYPAIALPKRFAVDDSMILEPSKAPATVVVCRGPNIGDPPSGGPCPENISGVVGIKVGDRTTTDHIMPAGSRLKYRSNIPKYAEFVFERVDPQFAARALLNRKKGVATIVVAGESYGQGSSREHAAICPAFLGVVLVAAKSIERIHRANLINFGIIPALFANGSDYDAVASGDHFEIAVVRKSLAQGSSLIAFVGPEKRSVVLQVSLTERERGILLAGGLINATKRL